MNANLIVVTGCFGAPVREEARRISSERGLPPVDLDREIEQRDGEGTLTLVRGTPVETRVVPLVIKENEDDEDGI